MKWLGIVDLKMLSGMSVALPVNEFAGRVERREGVCDSFSRRLNPILPTALRTLFCAFVAGTLDNKTMIASSKSVQFCNGISNLQNIGTRELDQLPAFSAIQMIVLGVTIVMFVNTSSVQFESIQQPSIGKFSQRTVNRRPGNIVGFPFGREVLHQLIGVKMLMTIEDLLN